MKKILTLFVVMTLTTSVSLASSFGKTLRNAIKQDFNNAKTEVKTTNKEIKKSIKSDYKAAKQEVKTNIKETKKEVKSIKNDIKNQYKTDVENRKKAQAEAEAKRKKEAMNQIDTKLANINKEMETVKKAENMSETERAIRIRFMQKQINYYNKQKTYLK